MPYLGRGSDFGVRSVFHFLATNGQTSVSGSDADGKALSFADGNFIDVYLNGVRLKSGEDYNTGTANTVAGLSALDANDEVNIVVYDTFTVADTVKASEGGTFSGAVTVTGKLITDDTTDATTTTDGSLQTDGGLSVVKDAVFGDDVTLKSDSAVLKFGADSDITITHTADTGLTLNGTFTSTGLASTTSGTSNFVAGVNAGNSIASGGNYNVTVGDEAGTALTTGDNNVAVGFEALSTEDAHGNNTAVGYRALKVLDAGADGDNVAVGRDAGLSMTLGKQNILVGGQCGDALTDADENVAMGHGTLSSDTLGSKTTAIGYNALNQQNFGTATNTMNTAVGYYAGLSITNGQYNTFVGAEAGDGVDDGDYNVAVGYKALSANCGQLNVAVGADALEVCTGSDNTSIGYRSGESITSGGQNVFIGTYCGDGGDDSNYCVAVGRSAMGNANFGDGNTSVGWSSGFAITGINNTMLGNAAGYAVTSGGNNICLGMDAGRTGSPGGNITTGSNEIALGDENISSFSCQVSLTATSDERDKTDFKDLDLGLDFVNALKPVTYVWDKRTNYIDKTDVTTYDEDGKPIHKGWDITTDLDKITSDGSKKDDDLQVGFKAQDVIALEDAAGYKLSDKTNLTATVTSDGKQYGLRYERFVPMLVKAVQELSAKNDALEARIKKLEDA